MAGTEGTKDIVWREVRKLEPEAHESEGNL